MTATETDETRIEQAAAAAEQAQVALRALGRVNANEMAEPEEDEGDDLVFVKNGWIRFTIGTEAYKLRRPFLGELKDLETSWESDQDELQERHNKLRLDSQDLLDQAAELEAEAKEIEGEDRTAARRKVELDIEATRLALEASKASRKLQHIARDLRANWWLLVFKTLAPPNQDACTDVPSWVSDVELQQRAITHWQSAPLARGG